MVMVTAPNSKTARKLARLALSKRLAACANIIPGLESHYWWQGKIERGAELLILFKTRKSLLPGLSALIKAEHPYDTPEIVAIAVDAVEKRYLRWWETNLGGMR
jgi:periplasmic divalent cation tolerance protein